MKRCMVLLVVAAIAVGVGVMASEQFQYDEYNISIGSYEEFITAADSLFIGDVIAIDMTTGAVTVDSSVALDTASLMFWQAIEESYRTENRALRWQIEEIEKALKVLRAYAE